MSSLPAVLSIATAVPANRYSQQDIYAQVAKVSPFYATERMQQLFMNSDIEYRNLYLDLDDFSATESVDDLHERYVKGAMELGTAAITKCLERARISVDEIDCIIAVSCTGYLCPGLSSLMVKHFGMKRTVQRADLLGMGCAGAMPGLQRAHDFVSAYPAKKALVLTVEICSACYFLDQSLETAVGNAICGDGAAAVVIGSSESPDVPKLELFETYLASEYIHTVGFEQCEGKWRIILSKDIRNVAGQLAKVLVDNLLERKQLQSHEIRHWILHSGGRKVIDGVQRELSLTDEQVRHSKCILKNFGNMSAPTVLFVLEETMRGVPQPGDRGLMLAMGPGLAIEGALLRW